MRITTKSIHESITFCNRAATHFSTLQTVCSTASYLSVWPTKKGAEAPHYFYDYTKKLLKDTQPNAEPACGYIKSKGPDLQSTCCRCPPQLLLFTVLFAIDDAGMADTDLAVGEKTVKVFPALKMPTKP